jgi:cell division protein FtsL
LDETKIIGKYEIIDQTAEEKLSVGISQISEIEKVMLSLFIPFFFPFFCSIIYSTLLAPAMYQEIK